MNPGLFEKYERELLILGARIGLKPDEVREFQAGLEALFDLQFNGEHSECIKQDSREGETS